MPSIFNDNKNRTRFLTHAKADEIVYYAFQLQAIRKHVAVQTNITKIRLISAVGISIKHLALNSIISLRNILFDQLFPLIRAL